MSLNEYGIHVGVFCDVSPRRFSSDHEDMRLVNFKKPSSTFLTIDPASYPQDSWKLNESKVFPLRRQVHYICQPVGDGEIGFPMW